MNGLLLSLIVLAWFAIFVGCWLGWQLLRQNGRILLRIDEVERHLKEIEFAEPAEAEAPNGRPQSEGLPQEHADAQNRFNNRSLARSRIKRDGLKAGTSAPSFRLPRLDGGELSLEELRGKRVLLVFSDPHCGPCSALAPQLEKFHRSNSNLSVVMISRGDAKENRGKIKEYNLTFPVVLQQRWEISRLYAMFATPIAYLIDEAGIIRNEVAVGVETILALLADVISNRG